MLKVLAHTRIPDALNLVAWLDMSVGSLDGNRKSWLPKVLAIAVSSDDLRASLVDYLREQYFCVEPKVLAICVGTSNSDLNGWICL